MNECHPPDERMPRAVLKSSIERNSVTDRPLYAVLRAKLPSDVIALIQSYIVQPSQFITYCSSLPKLLHSPYVSLLSKHAHRLCARISQYIRSNPDTNECRCTVHDCRYTIYRQRRCGSYGGCLHVFFELVLTIPPTSVLLDRQQQLEHHLHRYRCRILEKFAERFCLDPLAPLFLIIKVFATQNLEFNF